MQATVKSLNEGVTLSYKNMRDFKSNNIKKLNESLWMLYDLGGISNPSVYDLIELHALLQSESKKYWSLMFSRCDGCLCEDPTIYTYVLRMMYEDTGIDSDTYSIFKYVFSAITSYSNIVDIDNLYSHVSKKLKTRKGSNDSEVLCTPRLSLSSWVNCKLPCSESAFINSVLLNKNESLCTLNLRPLLHEFFCTTYLDISVTDYLSSSTGFMLPSLSKSDEADFIFLILNDCIEIDSAYQQKLDTLRSDYHTANAGSPLLFIETIFSKFVHKDISFLTSFKSRAGDPSLRSVFLSVNSFTYCTSYLEEVRSYDDLSLEPMYVPCVCFNYLGTSEFPSINRLFGLGGEFLFFTPSSDISAVGMPIDIVYPEMGYTLTFSTLGVYDVNQCTSSGRKVYPRLLNESLISYSSHNLVSSLFCTLGITADNKRAQIKALSLITDNTFSMLDSGLFGVDSYAVLVAELVLSLLYSDMGNFYYTFEFSELFSNVPKVVFKQACYDASTFYDLIKTKL